MSVTGRLPGPFDRNLHVVLCNNFDILLQNIVMNLMEDVLLYQNVKIALVSFTLRVWACCTSQFQICPSTPTPPPPGAIPRHLTRVKFRTVGNLTRNEACLWGI